MKREAKEEEVVYEGGQHKEVCDGIYHYQVDRWGRQLSGKCWCKEKANKEAKA